VKQRNPNPLEEALARSQRDEPHPDESALTAFAEGVLLKREREEVLAHLAVCCACRSVLGAAAAAAREHAEELHAAASVSGPKATGKASRPWFVWAGACAGILVAVTVAALVWQQHTTMEPRQDVATSAGADCRRLKRRIVGARCSIDECRCGLGCASRGDAGLAPAGIPGRQQGRAGPDDPDPGGSFSAAD